MAALHDIVISILGACAVMNLLRWRRIFEIMGINLVVTPW